MIVATIKLSVLTFCFFIIIVLTRTKVLQTPSSFSKLQKVVKILILLLGVLTVAGDSTEKY